MFELRVLDLVIRWCLGEGNLEFPGHTCFDFDGLFVDVSKMSAMSRPASIPGPFSFSVCLAGIGLGVLLSEEPQEV